MPIPAKELLQFTLAVFRVLEHLQPIERAEVLQLAIPLVNIEIGRAQRPVPQDE